MISKEVVLSNQINRMIKNGCFVNQLIINKLKHNRGFGTIKKLGEKSQEILKDFTPLMQVDAKSYLDIVNVQKADLKPISRKDLQEKGDVLFLDMCLTSLKPDKRYIKLLQSIQIPKHKCIATIQGFNVVTRESEHKTIYPVVIGGSYNPYIKYKSNRSSASRRMKSIDILNKLLNFKPTKKQPTKFFIKDGKPAIRQNQKDLKFSDKKNMCLLNINLTFPKEYSNHLFDLNLKKKEDNKICGKILKEFMNKNFANVGYWANLHKWKSTNPFMPHYHYHVYFINYSYINNKLRKIKSRRTKKDFQNWRTSWKHIIENNIPDVDKLEQEFNVWYKYYGNYNLNHKKTRCEMLHLLKYANRSYLIDVSKYFDINDTIQDERDFDYNIKFYKKQFRKFVKAGCIQNHTTIHGYLHNLKNIIRLISNALYYECYLAKHTTTFRCPVTGEKEKSDSKIYVEKLKLTENQTVYMGYKTQIVKIAEFKIKKLSDKPKGYDFASLQLRFKTEKIRLQKEKINFIKSLLKTKIPYVPLPPIEKFEARKKTDLEKDQIRINKFLDLQNTHKIKLNYHERIDLAIKGKC